MHVFGRLFPGNGTSAGTDLGGCSADTASTGNTGPAAYARPAAVPGTRHICNVNGVTNHNHSFISFWCNAIKMGLADSLHMHT